MRYYEVIITSPTGDNVLPSSLGEMPISSLLPSGLPNIAALNIEMDIPVVTYDAPANANSYVRIWGLSIKDIGSAFNLNPVPTKNQPGAMIEIHGGMSKGLPLADPSQKGILVKASVLNAYGNWIGVEQTLDIILAPQTGTGDNKQNYTLDWKANTSLESALKTTLSTALPDAKQVINISPRLVQNHDEPSFHYTLAQLNSKLLPISQAIITDAGYPGVRIAYDGVTITASDSTTPSPPIAINFRDLIGQPTWIAPNKIWMKTVMRADIHIFDMVTLPQTLVTTTLQAMTSLSTVIPRDNLTFSGTFEVVSVHHYGNFRQQSAESWCTVFEMLPQVQAAPS